MNAVLDQNLSDLDTLHAEARAARKHLVMDAVNRVHRGLMLGVKPNADDARIVGEFIGQRLAQNRYGK